jgi:hypothetical protein
MFCGSAFMSAPFQSTVTDTFLIEGRGLILSPFFPEPEYRFDKVERVRVETPDHKMFDVDADFDIPMVSPMPKVFQILCLLRHTQKADVPIGSKVTLLNKTAEQVAAPNSRPPSQLPTSPETQTPDSLRTPSSGGCG